MANLEAKHTVGGIIRADQKDPAETTGMTSAFRPPPRTQQEPQAQVLVTWSHWRHMTFMQSEESIFERAREAALPYLFPLLRNVLNVRLLNCRF